jgi:hypothetical protein
MKKKIILSLLVTLLLLLACVSSSASNNIALRVNGNTLYSPTPPQIINDRVMVPIRFVAEALNCNVAWDDNTNSVLIDNKKPASELPAIEGSAEFVEVIQSVLDLAKEKDADLYNWFLDNAGTIQLGYVGDAVAMNTINIFTKETTITFDENYFNAGKSKYSKQDLIMFHIGLLGHESCHTTFRDNIIYTDSDEEALCELAAVRAIEKVGGTGSIAHKFFKDSANNQLKL